MLKTSMIVGTAKRIIWKLFPRYYQRHLLIACLISGAVSLYAGELHILAGAIAYAMREIRDVEKSHNWDWSRFDWRGFLWPVLPLVSLDLILRFGGWV